MLACGPGTSNSSSPIAYTDPIIPKGGSHGKALQAPASLMRVIRQNRGSKTIFPLRLSRLKRIPERVSVTANGTWQISM